MKCPICEGNKFKKLFFIQEVSRPDGKAYPLFKCKNCGLIRPEPQPYNESKKFGIYNKKENIRFFNAKTNEVEYDSKEYKHYFKHFKPHLEIISKYTKKGGKILDIGCGPGHLLGLLSKKGYDVEGMDITKELVKALNKKYKVYFCEVGSKKMKGKKYDFLVLSHVIEHVSNPKTFVGNLNRLLNKGGRILVATPFLGGLIPKILRTKWYGLGYGQHLNFFSKKNLKMLFEEKGFAVEEFKILGVDYTHPKFPRILNLIASGISKIIVSLGLGDNLFMVAKKIKEVKK